MAETVEYLIVRVSISGKVIGDNGALLEVNERVEYHFGDGTGANQVGDIWYDEDRALDTTDEDLQLDALTATQWQTSSFNNIKVLYFRNLDTDAGDTFSIGGSGGGQPWDSGPLAATHEIVVAPGGLVLIVDPTGSYTVSAGDDLEVTAADTSTYDIILSGDNA